MNSQDIILGSRVAHVRELKTLVTSLKAENTRLQTELESLEAHFDLALTAALDLQKLSPNGKLIIIDGWNLILGAEKSATDRDDLRKQAEQHLNENPDDFVWIVYDGPVAKSESCGRLRVSYTGGNGLHRADKFICDFLRMAKMRGNLSQIEVKTCDKDFLAQVRRIVS